MANVGTAAVGKTLIGAGNGASPTYASIGTNSGLTAHGVVIAEGNSAFSVTATGSAGQILTSNGVASDPTFQSASASGAITTITGDTGGPESPSAGNFNVLGTGSITVAGSANTETVQLTGLTNHNLLIGAGTATITKVAPSATSGIPVISQGAAADPVFGTAVVAGGGTGQVTLTNHGVLVGQGTTAIAATAAGSAGQVLQSGGASADPVYSTATYPATASTSGNVITSDGTNFVSQALPAAPGTTLTNHSVALGTGTANLSSVGPDTTTGLPLISQGSSADPVFGTAVVAGGGTGQVTLTNHGVLIGRGTNAIVATATGNVGQVLQGRGSIFDPIFSTAAYPSTAGTLGNVITSDGTNFVSQALPAAPGTTLTNHSVALGTGTANLSSVGPSATSGSILQSAGSSADPIFSTAAYPSTAGSSGNVMTSNGTNWVSSAAPGGGLLTATGTLTSLQIKSLHGTPIVAIPAQGSGKVIVVVSASLKTNYGGSNVFVAAASQIVSVFYASLDAIMTSTLVNTAQIVAASNQICIGSPTPNIRLPFSTLDNVGVVFYNSVTTEISGNASNNNTMTWSITYYVPNI